VLAANDFSVREIISAIRELESAGVVPMEHIERWREYLRSIVPEKCYNKYAKSPEDKVKNWALFTGVSEFFRHSAGLSHSEEFIETQLASQLKWIDEKLTETDGERFRFLVTHLPQNNSVGCSFEMMGRAWLTADHDEFQEIMNRHKNVIHLSGHTHYDFDSDGLNTKFDAEYNNLYISAGCMVWCGVEFNQRREYYIKDRCTCQVIEVYEDCLVIRGLECVSGKFVARCLHRAKL
jgi:hypothetical protein